MRRTLQTVPLVTNHSTHAANTPPTPATCKQTPTLHTVPVHVDVHSTLVTLQPCIAVLTPWPLPAVVCVCGLVREERCLHRRCRYVPERMQRRFLGFRDGDSGLGGREVCGRRRGVVELALCEEEFVYCVLCPCVSMPPKHIRSRCESTMDCALVRAIVAHSFARAVSPVTGLYAVRAREVPTVRLWCRFGVHIQIHSRVCALWEVCR